MAESFNFSLNIGDGDVHPNFLELGYVEKWVSTISYVFPL